MARCCGGATCGCLIQAAGDHVAVTGSGSSGDPFIISSDMDMEVADNTTFNLSLAGLGTTTSPWTLSVGYATTAKLDDIPDVNAPAPTNGQVLGYDTATSKWTNRAPTTAASGSVQHDTSMNGDGSAGTPLGITEDPAGFLVTGAAGLGLTTLGINQMIRHFGTSVDRGSASPAPVLNSTSMLDSNPGQQDYWTGTQWLPVTNGVKRDIGPEMLALSGPYLANSPITMVVRNITAVTDSTGAFDVLTTTDLAGKAGVLSVQFQESGTVPFKAVVFGNIDHISATAYRIDDGTPYATQAISGTVIAYAY